MGATRIKGVERLERGNLNRSEAIQLARRLGVGINTSLGNGEILFDYRGDRVRANNRRKDVSRDVMNLLRRAARAQGALPQLIHSARRETAR